MQLINVKCKSLNDWHSKKAESMTEYTFDDRAMGKLHPSLCEAQCLEQHTGGLTRKTRTECRAQQHAVRLSVRAYVLPVQESFLLQSLQRA